MQSVGNEYRRLHREAAANRCSETLLIRYQREIIEPIQQMIDQEFQRAEQAHGVVATVLLESRKPTDGQFTEDRSAVTDLVRQLTSLREKLGEVLSLSKLRDTAITILTRQKELGESLRRLASAELEKLNVPVIATIAPLELRKNETRTVKHSLSWGTFSGDEYRVKFESTGKLKFPVEIRVPDDKDEVEYLLTALDEPGEYTLTLRPSVGQAVVVKVVVK
jgi:hypothetical protein